MERLRQNLEAEYYAGKSELSSLMIGGSRTTTEKGFFYGKKIGNGNIYASIDSKGKIKFIYAGFRYGPRKIRRKRWESKPEIVRKVYRKAEDNPLYPFYPSY